MIPWAMRPAMSLNPDLGFLFWDRGSVPHTAVLLLAARWLLWDVDHRELFLFGGEAQPRPKYLVTIAE